jgi:predicted glutamine amidotransferase
MCQLLGMNCNTPTDVTFSFTGFAQRGGRTDHHADGWGIAFFEDRGLRHFVDHQPACESPVAELIRRYPIQSRNVIAHRRRARSTCRTATHSCASCGGATGCSRTTAT